MQLLTAARLGRSRLLLTGGLWLVVLATTALLYGLFKCWAYDDPFITYRYATNLGRGLGFVYNPGSRVLSTTSPLWALVLTPLAVLHLDVHAGANLLSSFFIAVGGCLFWVLGRRWNGPWVGLTGALLYPTFPLVARTIGSEVPLYIALCLAAFAAYAHGRWLWMSTTLALATLARPDGVLAAGVLALAIGEQALRRRDGVAQQRLDLRAASLPYASLLAGWSLFGWAYFGSPLPATLAAKQSQGLMGISQRFLPGLWVMLRSYNRPEYWIMAALLPIGLIFLSAKTRSWYIVVLWSAAHFVGYCILGVTRYFWYYTPLVPGFVVLLGLGLSSIATLSTRRVGSFLSSALLVFFFCAQAWRLWQLHESTDRRYALYRAAGEWLAAHAPAEAPVGALEIGILGYYAPQPIVDFGGLIQPAVARQMGPDKTYDDTALWAIEHYEPVYLALLDGALPRTDAYAREACQRVRIFAATEYKVGRDLIIYRCN